MSTLRLVVFDLDGTLNRTELYAVPAHRRVMQEMGLPLRTEEEIIRTFGARAQEGIRALTGREDPEFIEEYSRRTGAYERELIKEAAGCYEGVPEMLCILRKEGYETAICSNSSERYIRMVLERLSILEQIDQIQPLLPGMQKTDTLRLLLERVKPAAAVMVGDRYYDMDAARANGIPFIGCLYGFRPEEAARGDAAVQTAGEIPAEVRQLIG